MTKTSELANLKDNSVLVTLIVSTLEHTLGQGSGTLFHQETTISESRGLTVGVHLHTELYRHLQPWSQGPATSTSTAPSLPGGYLVLKPGVPRRQEEAWQRQPVPDTTSPSGGHCAAPHTFTGLFTTKTYGPTETVLNGRGNTRKGSSSI